jgi:hypothetical protein
VAGVGPRNSCFGSGGPEEPKKQRHTAERIRVRLAEEQHVTVSGSSVRKLVAELKAEIGSAETPLVFVPQTRQPGGEAEVDWGQFAAIIGGIQMTLHLFSMWLGFSTRSFHYAYCNEAQESFTDAHMRAFDHFGVTVFDEHGTQIAVHVWGVIRNAEILDLDHYLEVLWRRPARCLPQLRSLKPERQGVSRQFIKHFGIPPGRENVMREDFFLLNR